MLTPLTPFPLNGGKRRVKGKGPKSRRSRRSRRGGNDMIVPGALAAYGIWHKYGKKTARKGKGKSKGKKSRRRTLLPKLF